MARDVWVSTTCLDDMANAVGKSLDGGSVTIHDGSRSETAPGDPLAILRLGTPAFGPARDGSITAVSIPGAVVRRDGTASWARVATQDGKWKIDVTVGVSEVPAGARYGIELTAIKLTAGVEVLPVMYTFTVGRGG